MLKHQLEGNQNMRSRLKLNANYRNVQSKVSDVFNGVEKLYGADLKRTVDNMNRHQRHKSVAPSKKKVTLIENDLREDYEYSQNFNDISADQFV